MPTGYTHELYEGEQDFEDFVLKCARAMGVAILLRDDPPGPIPEKFEASTKYHDEQLERVQNRFWWLASLTADDVAAEAQKEYDAAVRARDEDRERRVAMKARYEAMLERVQGWEPPTADHVKFKEFMVSQLQESIRFDCSDYELPLPSSDPDEWYQEQKKRAYRDLEYHTAERAKEIQRTNDRNAWVAALRESLGTHSDAPSEADSADPIDREAGQ